MSLNETTQTTSIHIVDLNLFGIEACVGDYLIPFYLGIPDVGAGKFSHGMETEN